MLKKDLLSMELLLHFAEYGGKKLAIFNLLSLNADHMKSVHLGTLSNELRSVELEIEFDSVHDTVKSRKWRPVDVVVAKKMMEDLSRNKRGDEGLEESEVFMN